MISYELRKHYPARPAQYVSVLLTLPLLQKLDRLVEEGNTTRSGFIRDLIKHARSKARAEK